MRKFYLFCEELGIEGTAELRAFFESAEEKKELDCDTCVSEERLRRLQEELELFPVHLEEVLEAARIIREHPMYLAYTNLLRMAVFGASEDRFVPFLPQEAGQTLACYGPLFALLAHVEVSEERMKARHIPREYRLGVHGYYERMLLRSESMRGFAGLAPTYYFWGRHYLTPDIYALGELEFEITRMPEEETILEEKESGKLCTLIDAEDCGTYYEGRWMLRGGELEENVSLTKLPKEQYHLLLQPGDHMISVHIPRGARIDEASFTKDYLAALAFFRTYYPERDIKAFTCHSWLMDPELEEILKPTSHILEFQHYYKTCPANSTGREVFSFVFYKPFKDYTELPEDTSLERALKKRYLEGRPMYSYLGVRMLE